MTGGLVLNRASTTGGAVLLAQALAAGLAAGLALLPSAAAAQRTEENATVQSADAFGTQIGNERTGLYSANEVRGFDPVELGNARIEGLYFDQIDRLPRVLTDRSAIRVGISAQGFFFPAPTGLVDHQLIEVGDQARLSIDADTGAYWAPGASLDFALPLAGAEFGIAGGMGMRNFASADGRSNRFRNGGLLAAWQPFEGAEIKAFVGTIRRIEEEARPTLFVDGAVLPPLIERGVDLSQDWSDRNNHTLTSGAIVRLPLGGFTLQGGLFLDRSTDRTRFADLLQGVGADGSVRERVIIADGGLETRSMSGELRVLREWQGGSLAHRLAISLRGRDKQRRFGSSRRLSLGASTVLAPDPRDEPDYDLRPSSRDGVNQLSYGVAYSLASRGGFSFGLGLSHANYRKQTDFADPLESDAFSSSDPLLWDVSSSYAVSSWLTVFAGASRGLEEALIAPESALNRSETPPAILSRQTEGGLRIALGSGLTLVGGGFRIEKPYFNLDPARIYRQLGSITVTGAELSLSGELAPGLSLVAGTVLLDPVIDGEAVSSGLIGRRPIGQARRRAILNLDWRPAGGTSDWSFDLALESRSATTANSANTLDAPAHASIDLGSRYRFTVGDAGMLLRLRVQNVLNDYGWLVSSSGGFTYTNGRTALVQLIADF